MLLLGLNLLQKGLTEEPNASKATPHTFKIIEIPEEKQGFANVEGQSVFSAGQFKGFESALDTDEGLIDVMRVQKGVIGAHGGVDANALRLMGDDPYGLRGTVNSVMDVPLDEIVSDNRANMLNELQLARLDTIANNTAGNNAGVVAVNTQEVNTQQYTTAVMDDTNRYRNAVNMWG